MFKKTVTYVDYNGTERTEDFYFHLSKAEIIKWLTTNGDYTLDKLVEKLFKENNKKKLMDIFEELIYVAYGEKSLDGRRFIKTKEVKDNFVETEAYSMIFTELTVDAKAAAEFFNGIIPNDLSDEISKIVKEHPEGIPDELKDYIPQ